jgi:hypothetical protein
MNAKPGNLALVRGRSQKGCMDFPPAWLKDLLESVLLGGKR